MEEKLKNIERKRVIRNCSAQHNNNAVVWMKMAAIFKNDGLCAGKRVPNVPEKVSK